ncbi:hypothetical protein BJ165DRAFT_224047 [Panaeolus papilionaceus]|nr:hypothetical protein BJ165DRAFT_224047 [Panaeolus papilionaceus]
MSQSSGSYVLKVRSSLFPVRGTKVAKISTAGLSDAGEYLLVLGLVILMPKTCRSLTSLLLDLHAFRQQCDEGYGISWDDLNTFCQSISGNNILERLVLMVYTDHLGGDPLIPSEPWSQLSKILASDVNFPDPVYGRLALHLFVMPQCKDLEESELEKIRGQFDIDFSNVMEELTYKPNIELDWSSSFTPLL